MASENWINDDEWELVDDDGFIYKRRKRSHVHPNAAAAPPLDPAAEERNRLSRKKNALMKIKQKYEKEIEQWEKLSSTLKEMELQAERTRVNYSESNNSVARASDPQAQSSDSNFRQLLDELISQADAQEAVIRNVSNLCDIADALCASEEERLKQTLFDLPIWVESPTSIVSSLCEE